MKALILAAGLGSRLRPLTDSRPKALVEVGGVTLLERTLRTLSDAGCSGFVVNVHHFGDQIMDFLARNRNFGLDIAISDERDLLRDTGGAIRHAAPLLRTEEKFLIHNVDIISNLDYRGFMARCSASAAEASLLVSRRQTSRYLLFEEDGALAGWTNVATGEVRSPYAESDFDVSQFRRLAFSGIHVFSSSLLEEMAPWPEKFSVIDFYLQMCTAHRIEAVEEPQLQLADLGTPAAVAEFEKR